ncbi:uncharacterized protein G2W53_020326 [Senna tora]|uniref:Uncharacterized protein n=1 Tax=Senna tora TaxID=362788 RepID=A0A834WNG7_9FABA|nr:uncharacterized protein G2W53_020326 [Senna tora]
MGLLCGALTVSNSMAKVHYSFLGLFASPNVHAKFGPNLYFLCAARVTYVICRTIVLL